MKQQDDCIHEIVLNHRCVHCGMDMGTRDRQFVLQESARARRNQRKRTKTSV